jgi:hypothetical protein
MSVHSHTQMGNESNEAVSFLSTIDDVKQRVDGTVSSLSKMVNFNNTAAAIQSNLRQRETLEAALEIQSLRKNLSAFQGLDDFTAKEEQLSDLQGMLEQIVLPLMEEGITAYMSTTAVVAPAHGTTVQAAFEGIISRQQRRASLGGGVNPEAEADEDGMDARGGEANAGLSTMAALWRACRVLSTLERSDLITKNFLDGLHAKMGAIVTAHTHTSTPEADQEVAEALPTWIGAVLADMKALIVFQATHISWISAGDADQKSATSSSSSSSSLLTGSVLVMQFCQTLGKWLTRWTRAYVGVLPSSSSASVDRVVDAYELVAGFAVDLCGELQAHAGTAFHLENEEFVLVLRLLTDCFVRTLTTHSTTELKKIDAATSSSSFAHMQRAFLLRCLSDPTHATSQLSFDKGSFGRVFSDWMETRLDAVVDDVTDALGQCIRFHRCMFVGDMFKSVDDLLVEYAQVLMRHLTKLRSCLGLEKSSSLSPSSPSSSSSFAAAEAATPVVAVALPIENRASESKIGREGAMDAVWGDGGDGADSFGEGEDGDWSQLAGCFEVLLAAERASDKLIHVQGNVAGRAIEEIQAVLAVVGQLEEGNASGQSDVFVGRVQKYKLVAPLYAHQTSNDNRLSSIRQELLTMASRLQQSDANNAPLVLTNAFELIASFEKATEQVTVASILLTFQRQLRGVSALEVWREVEGGVDDMPSFHSQPSQYMTTCGESLLSLVQVIEPSLNRIQSPERSDLLYWLANVSQRVLLEVISMVRTCVCVSDRMGICICVCVCAFTSASV